MNAREQRGILIAATQKLTHTGETWHVPSQTGCGKRYVVRPQRGYCSCPDHEATGEPCKHLFAVKIVIQRELFDDGTEAVTKTVTVVEQVERKTYRQDWVNYNRSQVNEHRHFQRLLADLCGTLPTPAPKPGRPPVAPCDAAFCATMKVYSTMSARRFMGDLQEARENGYISRVPHFNSVLNFFDTENATSILSDFVAKSAAPLAEVESDFAVDSTGFASHRYHRWIDEKYGQPKQKADWVKVHAIIGVRTNVVAAVSIIDKGTSDTTQFPGLVKNAAEQFTIREISADKAYTSQKNFAVAESVNAQFFPAFKKGTTGAIGGAYAKAFHMFAMNQEEYGRHYHKRSNVESTFSAIKRRFGEAVRSKTDLAMKNEAMAKIVCHNITCLIGAMYELGIDPMLGCTNTDQPAQILRLPVA